MRRFQSFQDAAAAIASLGLVLPPAAVAADASRAPGACQTPRLRQRSWTLPGRRGNAGRSGAQCRRARTAGKRQRPGAARAATWPARSPTAQGYFSVRGLPGGIYEARSAGGSRFFRLWTAAASPPLAHTSVLIVAGQQVNRGACPQPRRGLDPQAALILGVVVVGALAAGVVAWATSERDTAS